MATEKVTGDHSDDEQSGRWPDTPKYAAALKFLHFLDWAEMSQSFKAQDTVEKIIGDKQFAELSQDDLFDAVDAAAKEARDIPFFHSCVEDLKCRIEQVKKNGPKLPVNKKESE